MRKHAFTLLEMAFVIGLFGILALFLASRESSLLQTRFDTARQERVISDANTIMEAALAFYRLSPNESWPHTAVLPTVISIEGLMDMNALRDEDGNRIDSLLTDIPMNEYRSGLTMVPTMLPGITMLADMDYTLMGWATLPVPVALMGALMAPLEEPHPEQARWLTLSFWVVADGPGEARFVAASLPRGDVAAEHEIEAERRFYSRVQAAIPIPLDQNYLLEDWPTRATDLGFEGSSGQIRYSQPSDMDHNPKLEIRFGEDAAGDYFKLVRLKGGGVEQPGVEINFDDLKVPGDLTVGGAVMADVDFTDGVDIQGGTLTRADICRKERRLREGLTMVEDYLRRVDPIRYDRDPILTQDFCL